MEYLTREIGIKRIKASENLGRIRLPVYYLSIKEVTKHEMYLTASYRENKCLHINLMRQWVRRSLNNQLKINWNIFKSECRSPPPWRTVFYRVNCVVINVDIQPTSLQKMVSTCISLFCEVNHSQKGP